jgi:small basic protein (TIGR04137 family)
MSQHPSLRSSDKGKQHRSVLKRYERIKLLKDKEEWEEKDSVYGLPKVKVVRFKIKKEKAAPAEAETVAGAEGAATPEQAKAAPAAGKEAPKKELGKKEPPKPQAGGKK